MFMVIEHSYSGSTDSEPDKEIESIVPEESGLNESPTVSSLWESGGSDSEIADIMQAYKHRQLDLARLELSIVEETIKNPDIGLEGLQQVLLEGGKEVPGFDSLKNASLDLLEKFFNRHERVREVWNKNVEDPSKTYAYVFGKKPQGDVEVVTGPSVLYFKCHDLRDYAHIYHVHESNYDNSVIEQKMEIADESGGVKLNHSPIYGLNGGLLAENSHRIDTYPVEVTEKISQEIYTHELSHALLDLLDTKNSYNEIGTFYSANTIEELTYRIRRQAEEVRIGTIDKYVSNEILAYCVSGRDSDSTFTILTEKGGLYDYYGSNKDQYDETVKGAIFHQLGFNVPYRHGKFDSAVIDGITEKKINEVFVEDYAKVVKRGIESFYNLVGYGATAAEARNILAREDLIRWPRVAERFNLTGKKIKAKEEPLKNIHGSLTPDNIEDYLALNPHKVKSGDPGEWKIKDTGRIEIFPVVEYDLNYDSSMLTSKSEGIDSLESSFEAAIRKCLVKNSVEHNP